jgi:hypothetical protein
VERVANGDTAAKRARWLAELSDALEQARNVTKQLEAAEGRIEMVELYARIEAVRLEVQAMRLRRRAARPAFDPEWTDLPWQRSA